MDRRAVTGCLLACATLAGCGGSGKPRTSAPQPGSSATIAVTTTAHQTMDGFGAAWITSGPLDPQADPGLSPAHAAEADRLTFGELGLRLVRVFGPAATWTPADGRLAAMRRVQARYPAVRFMFTGGGAPVQLREPGTDAHGTATGALRAGAEERYADFLAAQLQAAADQGTPFDYAAAGNEPDGCACAFWVRFTVAQAARVYARLAADIRTRKLPTRLVVGDTVSWARGLEPYADAVLAAPDVRPLASALAVHDYRDRTAAAVTAGRELAARTGLPLWMTEWSGDDAADGKTIDGAFAWTGHVFPDDLIAADASAWLYLRTIADSSHGAGDAPLVRERDHTGRTLGFRATKVFHLFHQYTAAAPPGSRRLDVSLRAPGLTALAFDQGGGRVAVVLSNPSSEPRAEALSLGARPGMVTGRRTSATEDYAALPPLRYAGRPLALELPAKSVTTLTLGGG